MQSFGCKTVISSQSKLHIQSKIKKLLHLILKLNLCNKKTKLSSHLVTKQSFRHNLKYTPNQKTLLTKVVTIDVLTNNM